MQVNGKFRDFEVLYTASGENEVIAIIRYITLQKESAEELRKSEERYQTLARISPVGIFRTDANGNTTYVNPTGFSFPKKRWVHDGLKQSIHTTEND